MTDSQSVTAASAISQIKIDPARLQILQLLYFESENKDKTSHLIGPVDDYTIHSEFDIFPTGLPDVEDIRLKKKKSNDEKVLFEDCNNPPGTPERDYLSQITLNT